MRDARGITSCGIEQSTHPHPRSREGEKPPLVEEQDETTPGLHSALCLRRLFLSGRRLTSVEQDVDSKGGLCFSLEKAHIELVRLVAVGEVLAG